MFKQYLNKSAFFINMEMIRSTFQKITVSEEYLKKLVTPTELSHLFDL